MSDDKFEQAAAKVVKKWTLDRESTFGRLEDHIAQAMREMVAEKLRDANDLIELAASHCERPAGLFPDMSLFERLTSGYDEVLGERRELIHENYRLRAEVEGLKHDLDRYIEYAGDLATEEKVKP